MLHTIESLESEGKVFDQLVLLQPTSPVRRARTIERALVESSGRRGIRSCR